MAGNRQEGPLLLLSLLVTVALLAAGWLFLSRSNLKVETLLNPQQGTSGSGGSSQPGSIETAVSRGERLLFTDSATPDKQAAAQAFAAGDFSTAVAKLEASLQANRNDPEVLIYLNNARIGKADSLSIAVVVPIGTNPNSAREILRGVAQAQDEANRSSGTTPLKVTIGNDNNAPQQAKALAEALIQDKSILAVVGHGSSTTSLAAAPLYEQNQLVMIAPTSTAIELSQIQKGSANYIFRTVPSNQFTGTALARYMLSSLGKRQAIVFYTPGNSYSESLLSAFSTTLSLEGGQVVQQIDLTQSSAAGQVASSTAEVLVLLPDPTTLAQAAQVALANQSRMPPLPLLGDDALYTVDSLRQAGQALNGAVLPIFWHPLKGPGSNFITTADRLWAGSVNWRTALSYDAVRAILTGLAQGRGRTELAQVLATSGFAASGATGTISFLPSGDRNGGVVMVKVEPGRRSKTGYDFVPLP